MEVSRKWFDRFLFVLFELLCTVVLMVDVIEWSILYPTAKLQADKHESGAKCCSQFTNFGSIAAHALNFFMLAGDVLLGDMTIIPAHVAYIIVFPLIYGFVSWIIHSAAHTSYPYFFLDPSTKVAPAWYLALAFFHFVFFFIAYGFVRLRDRFLRPAPSATEQTSESSHLLSVNPNIA